MGGGGLYIIWEYPPNPQVDLLVYFDNIHIFYVLQHVSLAMMSRQVDFSSHEDLNLEFRFIKQNANTTYLYSQWLKIVFYFATI